MTGTRSKYYVLSVLGALLVAAGVLVMAPQAQAQQEGEVIVDKKCAPNPVQVGEQITCTIDVVTGPNTVVGVNEVIDRFPEGLRVTGATPTEKCLVSGNTVKCGETNGREFSIGYIGYGESFRVTIEAIAEQCGSFTNTATSQGDFGSMGKDGESSFNEQDTEQITVEGTVEDCAPPVAVDDAYTVDEDGTLDIVAPGVLDNDTDANGGDLTAELATNVTNGQLILKSDGSFTYTPNVDFSGIDSFTYKAKDGTLASATPAKVNITVDATAPTVASATPTKTTGVSRTNPNITATFSEPVDKATVEAIDPTTQKSVNVKLFTSGKQVAATVSCDADPCNKVTITPNRSLLAANKKYRAIVSTRVEDLAGNRLDQDPTTTGTQQKSWTFTTRR